MSFLLKFPCHKRSEVADRVGLLDDVKLTSEQMRVHKMLQQKVTQTVDSCRKKVREHFSLDSMRSLFDRSMEKDIMGTFGFATGAISGLVL